MDIILQKEIEDYWWYETAEEEFKIIFKAQVMTVELTLDKVGTIEILVEDTSLENAIQQVNRILHERYGDKDGLEKDIGWDILGIVQTGGKIERLEPEE